MSGHKYGCEHCDHTREQSGCLAPFLCLVLSVALLVFAYWWLIMNVRWTSIEGDCIVEKRLHFERTEAGDDTDVVQRICPATPTTERDARNASPATSGGDERSS